MTTSIKLTPQVQALIDYIEAFDKKPKLLAILKERKKVGQLLVNAIGGPLDELVCSKVVQSAQQKSYDKKKAMLTFFQPTSLIATGDAPLANALATYATMPDFVFSDKFYPLLTELLAIIKMASEAKASGGKITLIEYWQIGKRVIELIIQWKNSK